MNKNEILTTIKVTKETTSDFMDLIANFVLNHFDDSPEFSRKINKSILGIQRFGDELNACALELATVIKEINDKPGEK